MGGSNRVNFPQPRLGVLRCLLAFGWFGENAVLRLQFLIFIASWIQVPTPAQQASDTLGSLQRRYADGAVSHYLMTGDNDGWKYSIKATDTVKRDANGRYYEEIGWSDLTSNAQQTLTPARLASRQTVSLDDPAAYTKVPNLADIQPF